MKVDLEENPLDKHPTEIVINKNTSLYLTGDGTVCFYQEGEEVTFTKVPEMIDAHKALGLAIKYGWLKEDLKVVEKE